MYNVGNTVNFKSPDGVIQIDITLSDLIDISEGKGDLYSPIELSYDNFWMLINTQIFAYKNFMFDVYEILKKGQRAVYFHELQDIYKALTGKHLILK